MPQYETHDLESFLSKLTPKIEADLAVWYGPSARLSGAPSFRPRDWSFFFRYVIQVSGTENRVVLVKIRHSEKMDLSQAAADEKMKQEARDEYASLLHLQIIFGREKNSSLFFATRPLALYENFNAVVMEEADIRMLRSFLQSPKTLVKRDARRKLAGYFEDTGRWLRIFHDSVESPGDGPVFSEAQYEDACGNLSTIEKFLDQKDRVALKRLVDQLYKLYGRKDIPYRSLHDDFSCANIFVTGDERICSFDPKNNAGCPYVDLARAIVDMETCRMQVVTKGLWIPYPRMQRLQSLLLRGYFGAEQVDYVILNLYRLLDLLEKWRDAEVKLESSTGRRRLMYSLGTFQMRGYYPLLIRRLMEEKFQDL
jgi:hypothetical protein